MPIYDEINALAQQFASRLAEQTDARVLEMAGDDDGHYLIYRVLGVSHEEGRLIDVYQNKGRFLYKYAGSFLEQAAKLCFQFRYDDAAPLRIPNTLGTKPKLFEIDCLVEGRIAHEIKWRDATTDGDHITKEHTRLQVINDAGFLPVRVMFYYPNRSQAQRIQRTLQTLYAGVGGEYYFGDTAWEYIEKMTGVNLLSILERIAAERNVKDGV